MKISSQLVFEAQCLDHAVSFFLGALLLSLGLVTLQIRLVDLISAAGFSVGGFMILLGVGLVFVVTGFFYRSLSTSLFGGTLGPRLAGLVADANPSRQLVEAAGLAFPPLWIADIVLRRSQKPLGLDYRFQYNKPE